MAGGKGVCLEEKRRGLCMLCFAEVGGKGWDMELGDACTMGACVWGYGEGYD